MAKNHHQKEGERGANVKKTHQNHTATTSTPMALKYLKQVGKKVVAKARTSANKQCQKHKQNGQKTITKKRFGRGENTSKNTQQTHSQNISNHVKESHQNSGCENRPQEHTRTQANGTKHAQHMSDRHRWQKQQNPTPRGENIS